MPTLLEPVVTRYVAEVLGETQLVEVQIPGASGAAGPNLIADATALGALTDASADAAFVLAASAAGTFARRVPLSSLGRSLLGVADAAAARTLLGAGTPYTLPVASAGTLGGVRVGSGLSIDGSGVLSASGGGAVSSVFGRAGAVVAATGDYTAAQVTNAASVIAANTFTASQEVRPTSAAAIALTLRLLASQTGDSLRVVDSGGTTVARLDSSGRMTFGANVSASSPGLTCLGFSANTGDGAGGLVVGDGSTASLFVTRSTGNVMYLKVGQPWLSWPLVLQLNSDVDDSGAVAVGQEPSFNGRAKLWVRPRTGSMRGVEIHQQTGQTADLIAYVDSGRATQIGGVTFNGGLRLASMADASAANGTLYFSTTANKAVYKDAGGTVNALY